MMQNWGWGYGGMPGLGYIGMLLFWGLIVLGIVVLVRGLMRGGGGRRAEPEDSALELLKRRYARGEIAKVEFEEKKRDLV